MCATLRISDIFTDRRQLYGYIGALMTLVPIGKEWQVWVVLGLSAALASCVNDAAPAIGPSIGEGDLIITELRGPQTGSDDSGQFIEIYNASGGALDLQGLVVEAFRLDGSSQTRILVRDSLPVDAGGYATLGPGAAVIQPAYIDYPMGNDLPSNLYSSGAFDLVVVDNQGGRTRTDRLIYNGLPTVGSYSLGTVPPTANDNPSDWCTDTTLDDKGRAIGTPGLENQACN